MQLGTTSPVISQHAMDTTSVQNGGPLRISVSSLGVAASCLKEYEWSYDWGYKQISSTVAQCAGTVIHAGLESIWRGDHWSDTESAVAGCLDREAARFEPDQRPSLAAILGLLRSYIHHWDKWAGVCTDVEYKFELPLAWCGATLVGRFDAIADINGRSFVVEHKTTKVVDQAYFNKLRYDLQATAYIYAAQAIWPGRRWGGMLYDVMSRDIPQPPTVLDSGKLSKSRSQQTSYELYKAEVDKLPSGERAEYADHLTWLRKAAPRYFAREIVTRNDVDIREWKDEVAQLVATIRSGARWRNRAHCHRYGTCKFFDICLPGAHNPALAQHMFNVVDDERRIHGK